MMIDKGRNLKMMIDKGRNVSMEGKYMF